MTTNYLGSNGSIIAQSFDLNTFEGTIFPTSEDKPMQFGYSQTSENRSIKKHIHNEIERTLKGTSEFIYVISGKMTIEVFDQNGTYIDLVILQKNQALLQFVGGHSFEIDAGTKFFEIKQGPYLGVDKDKSYENTSK
jgi:hypothetical protein